MSFISENTSVANYVLMQIDTSKKSFRDISIIIPVGPREKALPELLSDLEPVKQEAEIIIVNGTARASQLNEGALKATRHYLWFLHADSRLVPKTIPALMSSLKKYPNALHYFILRFLPDGPRFMFLNEIGCWIRSRILGVPFGDQGFCVSKENFEKIGGFPEEVPYGEDHLFIWRARQKGICLRCTGAVLKTSTRRYAQTGWAKLTWKYARLWTRQAWPEWRRKVPEGARHLSLLIFAKYPEPGRVKTRLAEEIGAKEAAHAYQKMVEEVLEKTKPNNGEYQRILYYDPPGSGEEFRRWLMDISYQKPQRGLDLGERMENALAESLTEAKRAILIGTDCLGVERKLILQAFKRLEKADLVLGPAKDGGYYLIGCKKVHPELFAGIDWSTDRVCSQTFQKAEKLGLRTSFLQELEDIDTAKQYFLWQLSPHPSLEFRP